MSLASVANQPEWLKLGYRPKKDVPAVTEGVQKDDNFAPTPAKRSTKEPSQSSASLNMEVNRADVSSNQLPHGTRVMILTKDGRKVNGTVRWAGELPLEGQDPNTKIPVYGVETVSFLVRMFVTNMCMITAFSILLSMCAFLLI